MTDELQKKARQFINTCRERYEFETEKELTLYLIAKLTEEMGELTDETLGEVRLQRKSKLARRKAQNLQEEFGDVVVVLAALAEQLHLDLGTIISERVTKIKHHGE